MRISDWSADVCSSDLKIEAGRYEIVPAPFDPAEAARGAVQLMKGWADEGEVRLEACVPDRLPRAVADRRALRQILLNLLSHAIKRPAERRVGRAGVWSCRYRLSPYH